MNGIRSVWHRFSQLLIAPVSGASLAMFRIFYGLCTAWYAIGLLWPKNGINKVALYYSEVGWNFPYIGFEWFRPWPEPFLSLHIALLALSGLSVALGFWYRTSILTLFLSFTCVFLWEGTRYNNHYYLMSLLSFMLFWMPAQARFSLDSMWHAKRVQPDGKPAPAAGLVPFWGIFLIRAQLFIMYFFGGIAKIDADWLTGVPMTAPAIKFHRLLEALVGLPASIDVATLAWFLAWGGLFFDLSIGFLLVYRGTRLLALLLCLSFHLTNDSLFSIGVFPVLAFTGTLIFLRPDWPTRVANFFRYLRSRPVLQLPQPVEEAAQSIANRRGLVAGLVGLWLLVQLVFPLRHYFIPGDASWTEEGHRFAWRMMLRGKSSEQLLFEIVDPVLFDPNGKNKQINWDHWPIDSPRAVHVAIDCSAADWNRLPELMLLYEPCIGRRFVYNLKSGDGPKSIEEAKRRINQRWENSFGRKPFIHPTISLSEAIGLLINGLHTISSKVSEEKQKSILLSLLKAQKLAVAIQKEHRTRYAMITLADYLQQLADCEYGPQVRKQLARTHPFAVQGALPGKQPFLVVSDPLLIEGGSADQLQRLSGGKPFSVWLDLLRLRIEGWRDLPRSLVVFADGEAHILWNYGAELSLRQVRKFAGRPFMIHQYANRIADLWESDTGRRPQVYAHTAVCMNHRQPQVIVDPKVNLAATAYHLLKHNDWILPTSKRLPTIQEVLGAKFKN